jgi:predicted RND superfamily exporter protein
VISRFVRRVQHVPFRALPKRLLAGAGCVLVVGLAVGGVSRLTVETGVDSFLPSADDSVVVLDELARSFGGDPIVVLLESEGERQLLNEDNIGKMLQLEGRLSTLPDVATVYGPGTILNQIAGQTQMLLAELSGRRDAARVRAETAAKQDGAEPAEARAAGEQAVLVFDRRYGPLLVQAMPAGLPTLHNPVFVSKAFYNTAGLPHARWRFVVPSPDSVAILVRPREGIEAAATKELVDDVRSAVAKAGIDTEETTISGVPAVASAVGQQVAREIPVLGGLALLAVAACFLLVPWTRRSRRLVPVLTSLITIGAILATFGWFDRPLSLGAVAFLPILLGIGSYYPSYYAQNADARTVLAVAAATSASFGALTLSPLPFVRDLGIALAAGVLLAAIIGIVFARWLLGGPPDAGTATQSRSRAPEPRTSRTVFAGVAVAAVVGWAALPGLELQADVRNLAGDIPALADAERIEQEIGSSGELDIVLSGDEVSSSEAFQWMRVAQRRLLAEHGDDLRPIVSLPSMLTFLGATPTDDQLDASLRLLPPYLLEAVVRNDSKVAVLAFGVRSNDIGELSQLRDALLALLPAPPPGYEVELAGLPLVAVRGHELVSADRILANIAGIAAAGLVLFGALRRRGDALRAVVAGVLSTGLGYLALWLLGVPLSPVTTALGALTAAVGCEFTVLASEAARRGDRRLLRSVLLAATSSAAGYAVLAASGLAVIREFGILLAGSVLLALLSAAVVVTASVRPTRRTALDPPAATPAPLSKSAIGATR